ncbi:MAG: signal recognition particle-docking protein FtsY [Puniceicoccales bacterium]|jgi:fused signal recognition particle receptor|nr:signal recognition particle-docking protein FtsY [Puniceicoccales bacterium]
MFGLFAKVRTQVKSTKNKLTSIFKNIFHGKKLDQSSVDQIEALLYSADIGVETTRNIIAAIRAAYKNNPQMRDQEVGMICKNVLLDVLRGADRSPELLFNSQGQGVASDGGNLQEAAIPLVIGLIGANGSGKTTTAAKLAGFFTNNGQSVIVGACDTFRVAANEQIKIWADRLRFDLVESQRGADPASVAFDTCQAAIGRGKNVVILDTAGRLHNKSNLMAELIKLKKVIGKVNPAFPQHLWLVADAHLGANTITSAKKFHDELGLTGMIFTKLDGTSRGGAIVGIYQKLGIPVYFIGTGESPADLVPFAVDEYVHALVECDTH